MMARCPRTFEAVNFSQPQAQSQKRAKSSTIYQLFLRVLKIPIALAFTLDKTHSSLLHRGVEAQSRQHFNRGYLSTKTFFYQRSHTSPSARLCSHDRNKVFKSLYELRRASNRRSITEE